jgi:acyl carrier protein
MLCINTEQAVINSLRRLGLDADQILPIHDLHCDLGVDSTEMVELAALVRTECGLATQRIDLDRVRTVGDLVAQIEFLINRGSA